MKKYQIALLSGASAILTVSSALAQSATQPEVRNDPGALGISPDDIVVTAQRRDESLSKTPVAVAVVSADTLAKAQIVSEQDLRTATPGLSVRAAISSNQLNYALRGQSQDAYSNTRPGVLPYTNEVQIGGSGGSTAFYDLQSVQVLKGPQGTLFGRSATGGAVLFTTAKPTDEFGGYISGLYGNYHALKLEGALNLPLAGDQLMARVAGFYQERDGFQRNLFNGGREGDLKRAGMRGSITAVMGAVRNGLVVDYMHSDSESTIGTPSGLLPFTGAVTINPATGLPVATPPFVPLAALFAGTATPGARATGIATGQGFLAGFGFPPAAVAAYPGVYDAYFASPRRPAGGLESFIATQKARGPFTVNSDAANTFKATNVIVTNATTIELNDTVSIKNIFGYTHLKNFNQNDGDGTPYFISGNDFIGGGEGVHQLTRQLSNETQLLGAGLRDRLSYVLGFYYSNEKLTNKQRVLAFDILFGGFSQQLDFVINNKTYAGYAQGTYQLNDNGLAFTLGARYTSEKVGIDILPTNSIRVANPVAPPGFTYAQSAKFNRVSWQIGLQQQVDPNLLVYAVSRRAYKSGGFNGTVPPRAGLGATGGNGFRAERVTDAELGAKFQGRLGAMPVRLGLAAFHNWVDDAQRAAYTFDGNLTTVTINVPKTTIYGLELDANIRPADWFTIGGSFNYTKAKVKDGRTFASGAPQLFDRLADTPKSSGVVYADVTIPLSGALVGLLHGDVYAQSKSFTSPQTFNSVGTTVGGYALANFRVGLEQRDAGWSLTANLKNAFDRTYYVGGVPTGAIYQLNTLIPGEPRTITVEARLKF